MNLIVILINVDINKKRDEIHLKKLSFTEMKNSLTDQLFFELSAVISTSDSLAVRVISAKSALTILHYSLCRAVRAALKNIDLLVSANLISQSVRMIPDSDPQAVIVALLACRSHN